jgi:hypothetical protein
MKVVLNVLKMRTMVSLTLLGLVVTSNAWAIAAPTDTTAFLYPVFDLVYNKMGAGPAMFTIGFIGICVAGFFLFQSQYGRVLGSLIATAIIVGAGSIVPTLGVVF